MTPCKRRVVAEACDPIHPNHGIWIIAGTEKYEFMGDQCDSPARAVEGQVIQKMTRVQAGAGDTWRPKIDPRQREALVRRCAVLIHEKYMRIYDEAGDGIPNLDEWPEFCEALATNNTDAIEELVFELISGADI